MRGFNTISKNRNVVVKPVELILPPAHQKQYEFITHFDKDPKCRFLIGAIGSKWGKLVDINTVIPTTNGWKKVGDLVEGEYLFDIDGKPTKIEFITDTVVPEKSYRVTFSDGNYVDCCSDHLWEVKSHLCRKAEGRVNNPKDLSKSTKHRPEVLTTEQIKENLYYTSGGKTRPNYTIDCCQPVQFPEQDLPIEPRLYGQWLGDGTSANGSITCDDKEQSLIDGIKELGYTVVQDVKDKQHFTVLGLKEKLKALGVLNNKSYIPELYRIGSIEQRLDLLKGLMDSDGTIDKNTGYCTFDNTNKVLVDLVVYLAQSLGIKVNRSSRIGKLYGVEKKKCYRAKFKTNLPVFSLPRKLQYINKVKMGVKSTRRAIVAIESIPSVPMKCIRVDNPRHLFLITEAFIPTHNTLGCCMAAVRHAWNNKQHLVWWVAPTYKQAENAYNTILRLLPEGSFKEHKASLVIDVLEPSGKVRSSIEFKSGEDAGNLRGFGVNFVIVDEAAYMKFDSYISIKTTLTQTRGKAIIISTPKGRGWFYDVYKMGQKYNEDGSPRFTSRNPDPNPDYFSYRLPTYNNPHITAEAIDELRRSMPDDSFRQEILAEFLSESAGVFRNINKCITGDLAKPNPGIKYTMGVDLARINDYTVIIVTDQNNHVVSFDRFNKIDWSIQQDFIKNKAQEYNNCLVSVDSTGVGDPVVEALRKLNLRINPYKIGNNVSKKKLIDSLRVSIEQQEITFPDIPQLVSELESYEYTITDGGVMRYSAPSGKHDDCVIALALANWSASTAPFVYKNYSVNGI